MRIVISGYIGKKVTGIGRNLVCILNEIESEDQYIIYTNADMKENFKFNNPRITVKTYNISKDNSIGNLLWTTFIFPFVALKEHADVVLIPNFTLLLFKFKPTVVHMPDLIEFNVPDKFSKLRMFYRTKIADPITARNADHIIAASNNSKKDIIKFLKVKEDKISVVYNAVDRERFHKINYENCLNIIAKREWPSKFILYAGTVDHPGKNAITVIKSFEKAKKMGIYSGALLLAGMPGAGHDYLKKYIDTSNYNDEIIETGYVADEELVALYSLCDVFCFVSLYEGFGIPALEALACGAKAIVSNTSSLPEVVGDCALLTDPLDVDSLVQKIETVISGKWGPDPILLKKHLSKFQWSEVRGQYESILSLVSGKR